VIVSVSSVTNGSFPAIGIHTWSATDICGNSVSASQTNTVNDTMAPVLAGVPTNEVYECIDDVPAPTVVTATDNCDTNVIVSVSSVTNGSCPTIVIHTWSATDGCGNSVSASQTNTVNDTIAPLLVGVPGNEVYQCIEDVPAPTVVTATDNCDTNVVVSVSSTTNGSCPAIVIHTWSATDGCGNSVSASQTNTVHDTMAPVLVGVPPNEVYECIDDVPAPTVVMATDNCDTNVIVSVSSVTNGSCPAIVIHTWSATDFCGNSVSASQTNTVNDTMAPVLAGVLTNEVYE
jgi:hypothetical protein